ncbi:putative bifunctional diguanylate cyclase/phosphodiesterase [Pararhizobium haloflavum]|uniref:putative bifunctional diguanylate cyclase/phosphodiesterase n=1 Tax=Pararhizobium haloflavum TaxID=2037914 RepID=UPI000C1989CD|nr:bifunctional diguanylate cyclase/phosphodiesterase [Pararhizobium haloflavum]
MMTILSCLVYEHDPRFLAVAVLICTTGCYLTIRLFSRVRRSSGGRRIAWLFLTSLLAGGTIWTTHFTAMIGYLPSVPYGFDAQLTYFSLVAAVACIFIAMLVSALARESMFVEVGGALIGLSIATVHYIGMAAYDLQGTVEWDRSFVVASAILGAAFGALAMNRLARPHTRYCRHGSTASLLLAICAVHFTGMGAMTVVPDASSQMPELVLPQGVMMTGVVSIMLLILAAGAAVHFIDSENQNEAIQRYRHLAMHDPLTGLPNRTYLTTTLDSMTRGVLDPATRLAIVAFDLNRFKQINDVHGHTAGDALLRELGRRLAASLRDGEVVTRIGGDEFVAIKPDIQTKSQARAFAERIIEVVEQSFEYKRNPLSVGASIGISLFPTDGRAVDMLLTRADLAMYRAKEAEGQRICFYDVSMDESNRSKSALAFDLRQAIARNELELYYQAQNDTASRRLVGFEALLRWNHAERGLVSPVEFIPIAEQSGLICDIGEWVIREACNEAATWQDPFRVAVNVAPLQLAQNNLPTIVHEALLNSGLEASRLELEITESGIIADQAHALHIVRQLKALGVRIAMDDYGTGYSSLATLKNFPFDKIKIDRSFVDGVISSPQSAAIVRATIILGASLDIPVLAEGVETEEHLEFLNAQGCKEVQGYFFGRPMPQSQLDSFVRQSGPVGIAAPETARPKNEGPDRQVA